MSLLQLTEIKKRMQDVIPYFYVLPSAILVSVFFVFSAVFTLGVSFTEWDGLKPARFVGLDNYVELFTNPIFVGPLLNTMYWVVLTLALPVGIGLFVAVALQQLKSKTIYQSIFFLPFALSATTTGVIGAFLASRSGLPAMFEAIGFESLAFNWLNEPPYNTMAMIGLYTWASMGTNMILFLVGLQAIPKDPIEAALIDGATGWKLFANITFPLLRPMTSVVVLMALVNSFKVFEQIWVMTMGGPYRSSETLAVTMYSETFLYDSYGSGSAVAVVLSILIILLSAGYLKRQFTKERN
jgi:multiple sugar transport system permease protein